MLQAHYVFFFKSARIKNMIVVYTKHKLVNKNLTAFSKLLPESLPHFFFEQNKFKILENILIY